MRFLRALWSGHPQALRAQRHAVYEFSRGHHNPAYFAISRGRAVDEVVIIAYARRARMSKKTLIWLGLTVGSGIGGYLPALWGGDLISFSSVVFSAAGGIVGIWLGYRFGE